MKPFSAALILGLLFSCVENKSTPHKSKQEERRSCGNEEGIQRVCLTPATWILNTRLMNLPAKMSLVEIYHGATGEETRTIGDSCLSPKFFTVISNATGSSIFFKGLGIGSENFTLKLIDRGADCKGNSVVISADLMKEDVRQDSPDTFSIDLN